MLRAHRGLLLVCLGAATLSSTLFSRITCQADDSNINKQGDILQKFVEFSGQPLPDRMKLMQSLPPDDRSFLWRVHLALYLAQRPNLTKDQQAVVLDTLDFVSPKLFSAPDGNDPTWRARVHEPLSQLQRRGLQLFEKEEAAEIFSMFGQRSQEVDALRKYLSLSELRRSDRKAMFAKMSAQEKSDLWHVHFALNMAARSDWNEQQRSLVLEAATIVTPKLYELPNKSAQWLSEVDVPLRVFTQRALLAFSKSEATALFAQLGGSEPSAAHNHAKPTATPPPCDCAHESDWCVSYDCWSNNCKSSQTGCGTLWIYPCDGLCFTPPMIN